MVFSQIPIRDTTTFEKRGPSMLLHLRLTYPEEASQCTILVAIPMLWIGCTWTSTNATVKVNFGMIFPTEIE